MRIEDYLAIPYESGGRTVQGCDCWGLARLILIRECGVTLPLFSDIRTRAEMALVAQPFRVDAQAKDWDLVLMKGFGGYLAHIGLYWHGGVVHMTEAGVAFQPLPRISSLVFAFYDPVISQPAPALEWSHEDTFGSEPVIGGL